MLKIGEKYIKLDTENTSLIFQVYSELLEIIYYGKRLSDCDNYQLLSLHKRKYCHSCTEDIITANTTFSCYGMATDREYSIELVNYDGGYANKFLFKEAKRAEKPEIEGMPYSKNSRDTLELVYEDREYNLELHQYFSTFDESDVIATSSKLINKSENDLKINRFMSCQLDLDESGYEIYTYTGAWSRERNLIKNTLNEGIYINETKCGMSSHKTNPFIMIKSPERKGGYYAFNLVYSGSHKEIIESTPMKITRVIVGINDFGSQRTLKGGEFFHTPEAVMTYGEDKNSISHSMHNYVNNNLIKENWKKARPIVVNMWGNGYDFNPQSIMDFAKTAKELGIEMLVIDDGWFSCRNSIEQGLGDWTDNVKKTGGLVNLVEKIHNMGLKFGIWVEPEMMNYPGSELCKNHPDWIMKNPKRDPAIQRCQVVLDLTNEEVQNYIISILERIIGEYKVDYIKWDCNRTMTDGYSIKNGGEDYFYKYIKGLYKILSYITDKYPHVLFEGCSAGGGRFDLGMLCYMPQIWTSDMTDPYERVLIQEGTLIGYPPSAVSCHVAGAVVGSVDRKSRMMDRFNVAIQGVFGYECDITKFTHEEKEEVKKQIEFYKNNRELLQFGRYYNIESAFDGNCGVNIVVSKNQERAIASIFKMQNPFNREQWKYKLAGLKKEYTYKVSFYGIDKIFRANGDMLCSYGLDLNDLFKRTWDGEYFSTIHTLTAIIEKI